MSRLFRLGDLHGGINFESFYLLKSNFPLESELTKNDVVFQLGDFGYVWYYPESKENYKRDIANLNHLADKNYTLLVIPGNHDNYDIINSLPIINKWDGRVYELKLRKNSIYFAIKGEIYTINNKNFFTFGGAATNKEDQNFTYKQYLSKEKVRKKKYKYGEHYKTVHESVKLKDVSIWREEDPSEEEKENAIKNLEKVNYKVDYVLTHTIPTSIIVESIKRMKSDYEQQQKIDDETIKFIEELVSDNTENQKKDCKTSSFLEIINKKLIFEELFYGHFHHNFEFKSNGKKYSCHYKLPPTEIK